MSKELCKLVDHTILKPDAARADVKKICKEAKAYGFASVCINPVHVAYAAELLHESPVNVCTVIGFPLGANTSVIKAAEAKEAIANGADEVDMVINIGAAKEHDYETVKKDVEAVRAVVDPAHVLKVIIETCLLTDEEKVAVCKACQEAALMYKTVGPRVKVKASGGIRCTKDAEAMVAAGASRLGCSAGVKIAGGE